MPNTIIIIIIIIIWDEYYKYDTFPSGNLDYQNYLYILFIQITKNSSGSYSNKIDAHRNWHAPTI